MYPYYLIQIKDLLRDMGLHKVKQDKFSFQYNKVKFDVVVLIEREPFELLFGVVNVNFCFTLRLFKGYKLEVLPEDVFYALCQILNLRPGKEGLTSLKFLDYFASRIPSKYSGRKIQPDEIAVYKKKNIDESDKIYFKGWRTHVTDGKHVRNLEKTRAILGDEAYEYCKKYNISSCWSDNSKEKISYYSPEEFQRSRK